MSVIQGILLGILQGVAEFLPISSSGHLQVVQTLFGLEEVPLLYDVFLHLATLLAVCLYFWRTIWDLLKCFGRLIARRPKQPGDDEGRKMILAIIISSVFTAAIGIITSKYIPEMPVKIVCCGFLITAILLIISAILSNKKTQQNQTEKPVTLKQSIAIGIMQGIGTLPGISRSGSTIAGALFCGVDRKTAGEYSFIVSIPAILGAFILELKDLGEISSSIGAAPVISGCAAAFAVGFISLTFLMKLIRKGKLQWFAAYLIPVGILGILFL